MKILTLKDGDMKMVVHPVDSDNDISFEVYDESLMSEPYFLFFNPVKTRELIAHLTNCLKEVENG